MNGFYFTVHIDQGMDKQCKLSFKFFIEIELPQERGILIFSYEIKNTKAIKPRDSNGQAFANKHLTPWNF